jgi:hypothetical protein
MFINKVVQKVSAVVLITLERLASHAFVICTLLYPAQRQMM